MLRLTHAEDTREPREVLPFPSEAARFLRNGTVPARSPDRGACDAARRVEAAMADVERRFARLRLMVDGPDNNRPRAA
jgi:hypothetical protein